MLWELVKFKVRATFRKSAIAVYAVVLLVLLLNFFSLSYVRVPSPALYELTVIGIIILSLIFLTNSIYTSFFIQKSDVDFLYMLPVNERELEVAYSVSAFLINLISAVVIVIVLFPVISFLSVPVVLMVALMSAFSFFAFKSYRKVISPLIAIWMLSSILRFPFSPFSMLFGYVYGYLILAGLDIITVFLGIKNASIEELINEFYRRQGLLTPPGKITTSISLYSSSPLVAMLKRNFNFIEIGGRINIGTGIPYIINKRVKMYKILPITIVIGIVNYTGFSLIKSGLPNIALLVLELNIVLLAGLFIILFTTQSAFVNEPLWLNLSVMTPVEFARKYLLAKTLSVFILFLPISISVILLNPIMGIGSLFIPLTYTYGASVNARFYPVLLSQTPSYDARVLTGGLSVAGAFIPIYLDSFLPIFGVIATLVGVIVTLVFTLPFLLSKGYWERTFEKTITSL